MVLHGHDLDHKLDVPAWATNPHAHFAAPAASRLALEATVLGTVSVTVTNTGAVAGDEVVFLFQDPRCVVRGVHAHDVLPTMVV